MNRVLAFFLLLFATSTFAQQNPLANTRWGCYMGGPGGGYLAMDYYFSDDTVYGILTALQTPPTKMFIYSVNGNAALIRAMNITNCNNDVDTFSFTIVADTLDFAELSSSCPSLAATWNPYFFIRTSLTGLNNIPALEASIYPNPATNTIYINRGNESGNCTLQIYDVAGALVKTEKLLSQLQPVDVSNLSPGIYIAQIQSGKQFYKQKITID